MPTQSPATSQRLLTAPEAAEFLRLTPSTLAKWRCTGAGPIFVRLGSRILYRQGDLESWISERVHRSTSEDSAPAALAG